ncbi:MAG: DUF4097 family beta strand repeat protein [Tissierellales bacterium]|nr:DUF4097 family beta strand repeat protein [Tissierellales bacterium]MBN2828664.1 DUF4097 family beta strand repeat protein [Tissierellales bacterium]
MNKNIYKEYKLLILFVIVLSLSVFSTGCMWSLNPLSQITSKTYTIDEERSFSSENFENIDVSASVKELHVIKSNNQEIQISLKGSIKSNYKPGLVVEATGRSVAIRTQDRLMTNMNESKNSLVMTIHLPENYSGSLDVGTVSGDIDISSFSLNNLSLSTVSGDIHAADMVARSLKISSVSGSIKAESVKGVTGRFSTTSGKILAGVEPFAGGLHIASVSGDVDLQLPENADCGLEFSTVSGKFENGNGFIVDKIVNQNVKALKGSGKNSIKVVTTSGNLDIK